MENQNQESGSGQQTINIQIPSADNIASRRSLIPLLFAMTIIFFFFNFFTVSCGGQKVGSVTGLNLVTGTELKGRDMFSGNETKGEKIPTNIWALIALGASVIGLATFLIKDKREAIVGTGVAAIGFGSLIILQFAIKNAIEMKAKGTIQTDFQFAYWGALIAIGIAGIICYLRIQKAQNIIVSVESSSAKTSTDSISQPQSNINSISSGKMKGILFIICGIILPFIFWFGIKEIEMQHFEYVPYGLIQLGIIIVITLALIGMGIKSLVAKNR